MRISGTEGLSQRPGENQGYQKQACEPHIDCPHDDHRPDPECDQASHVDPVLEILEKVFDIISECADGFSRGQRHHPGAGSFEKPPEEVSLELERMLVPVGYPDKVPQPDDEVAADGDDGEHDHGAPGGLRHWLAGGETVEDPPDQDSKEKRRAVDQRPHHQAEEEPTRPVLDQFPQDSEGADRARRHDRPSSRRSSQPLESLPAASKSE